MKNEYPIGWLAAYDKGHIVICPNCKPDSPYTCSVEVYNDNIGDYQQHCWMCKKVLREPKTPAWPELFDGRF